MTLPPQQQALVYGHYELCIIRSAIERVYNRQARRRIGQNLVVNISLSGAHSKKHRLKRLLQANSHMAKLIYGQLFFYKPFLISRDHYYIGLSNFTQVSISFREMVASAYDY